MEHRNDIAALLEHIPEPAFLVKENIITECSQAAARVFLRPGTPVDSLFASGYEEYRAGAGSVIHTVLRISGEEWGASIVPHDWGDLFVLNRPMEDASLRALALAARELREPLSDLMLAAEALADAKALNRGLYQLLRIVGNMSDASGSMPLFRPEMQGADALFREVLEKASAMADAAGITVTYDGLKEETVCPLDRQMLERAALNMLSNAIKYADRGSVIRASLHRSGKQLRFSVQNSGDGIPEEILNTLFCRYLRGPVIEDGRHGIGLGMLLIRNAAARHGGAVLADRPEGQDVRVSITLRTDLPVCGQLNSSRMNVDYAGELDHTLLELSQFLPTDLY